MDNRVGVVKLLLILAVAALVCERCATAKVRISAGKKYTVDNVKIYSKSNNATMAKELALKEGERTALKELFEKIGINKNYTKYVNDNLVADMIATIKISEEVMTNNSYSGVLTVVFDSEFVRYNLGNLGIKAGKTISDVILYIPIFDNGTDKLDALDNSNIWYQAAYDKFFEDNFDDIFLIDNYSLSNSGLINKNRVVDANYTSFETLLMKYVSNVVLISLARYNRASDSVDIVLREITAEGTEEKILNYLNKNGLPKDKLIEYASVQLFEFIKNSHIAKRSSSASEENPRKLTKVKPILGNYIDILIPTQNLKELVFVKNLVIHFSFIKSIDILELTVGHANMRLYFSCNESELVQMFRAKNFSLSYNSGQYFLNYQHNNLSSPLVNSN
ncbi:MAG: hypothetical protein LBB13_00930 [Rickettsiales bacterium]|jgi:hypothetical protein|nr:hypothetical protein [Rickettsiales bacterium]